MPKLLILHGWGSSQKKWARVKEILTRQGIEVFVPDLPGFGENPPPKESWSVDNYVEWVKNYSRGFTPFFLLGHSFGGRIAIKFAVKYPEIVLGLILAAVPAIKSKPKTLITLQNFIAKNLSKLSFLPFYQFFRKFFYIYLLRKVDYINLKGELIKGTFKNIIGEDLSAFLPQIKTKTLIAWGEKDDYVPVKMAGLIKEKIPNSDLIIFPKVKHSPYLEIPAKFAEIILRFLRL